jgi:hypothetical protein
VNNTISCDSDDDCPAPDYCFHQARLNEGNQCVAFNRLFLLQDPQSHHSLQFVYNGTFGTDHAGWGRWTYKFEDSSNPLQGQPCDPMAIDPALGVNPGCSTDAKDSVACINYGPPDMSNNILALFGVDGVASNFNISQEPIHDIRYPDNSYDMIPLKSVMIWNSHAFNLTSTDTTLAQYLNLEFAQGEEQQHRIEGLFDARSIFIQNVPPFGTREYCRTWTAPKGARLFRLSSHTHKWGTRFRIWAPPNNECAPSCEPGTMPFCFPNGGLPPCSGPRSDEPMYYSTDYADPVQLYFDPSIAHDENDPAQRTYLYCALYDNGATPSSPPVKQWSLSATTPFPGLGGPCDKARRACMTGPHKGVLCAQSVTGVAEPEFCETSPGEADGQCDACPVIGGVTTDDEMFALFGDYYCPGGCAP